jgi:hypothetical protein
MSDEEEPVNPFNMSEEELRAILLENEIKYPLPPGLTGQEAYEFGHQLFDMGALQLGALVMRIIYRNKTLEKTIEEMPLDFKME